MAIPSCGATIESLWEVCSESLLLVGLEDRHGVDTGDQDVPVPHAECSQAKTTDTTEEQTTSVVGVRNR